MPLKEMDIIVDGIDQADMLDELEHGRDACIIDRLSSLSKFVLYVIGGENGIGIAGLAWWVVLPSSNVYSAGFE